MFHYLEYRGLCLYTEKKLVVFHGISTMVCFHGIVDLDPMHIHLKKIVKFHGISATVMFPWCSLMYIRTWRTCESVIFYCRQTASGASPIQVLVWPGGKALRQWEERQRFKSTKVLSFCSKAKVYGHLPSGLCPKREWNNKMAHVADHPNAEIIPEVTA